MMKHVTEDDAALAVEMASLTNSANDDHRDDEKDGILKSTAANSNNTNTIGPNIASVFCGNFWALSSAYVSYVRLHKPGMFWTLACLALLLPSILILMDVFDNPIEQFGVITNDYSNINLQSDFDHTMKDIDHWCLKGDNDSCRCEDPTLPAPRNEYRRWGNAHAGNVAMIGDLLQQGLSSPDIAFLGGTVVEKMDGRWFGDVSLSGLNQVADIFNKHFGGDDTDIDDASSTAPTMTAAALGIAADLNQSVLWRIMNGEMPENFNPKIWWLELGLNDLGRAQCSEEVVIIGVLRIVEEIKKRKPDAIIVINSLFPMTDLRGGLAPPINSVDLQKSFGGPPPKGGWNKAAQQNQKQQYLQQKLKQQQERQNGSSRPRPDLAPPPRPVPQRPGVGGTAGMPPNIAELQGKPKVTNFRPRTFKHQLPRTSVEGNRPFPNGGPNGGNNPPRPNGGSSVRPPNPAGGAAPAGGRADKRYYDNGNNRERHLRHDRGFRDPNNNAAGGGVGVGGGTNFRRDRTNGAAGLFQRNQNPAYVKLGRDHPRGEKQHQFNPITRQERALPLWTSIVAINLELRKFCNKNDGVHFFDVTNMFTERDGYNYNLKTSMITRFGLPTNAGFEQWETVVAKQAKHLLGYDE